MQDKCGADKDIMAHIEIARKMAVEKRAPSPGEIKRLEDAAKSLRSKKDRLDEMRCAVDKCGKEWSKLKNESDKAIAGKIDDMLRIIRAKTKQLKSKKK